MNIKVRGWSYGFAIVEIIIIVSIISLLASVIFANIGSARAKARDAVRISDLKLIGAALDLYRLEHGSYPDPFPQAGTLLKAASSLNSGNVFMGTTRWPAPEVTVPPSVTTLTDLLAPYIKLPLDPRNVAIVSGGVPSAGTGYGYYYHYNTSTKDYDLLTLLETPSHPASCGVMRAAGQPYIKRARFSVGASWCPTEGAPTDNIYAVR